MSCLPPSVPSVSHLSIVAGSPYTINANLVAFLAQETKLKTVPYASLHRRLTFPPFAMAPCATDRKRVHFMEPVSRLSCRLFHTLPTFIVRSFRNSKAAARCIRLKPQIAGFGSQRMCPSCRLITSQSKVFCLECGEPFPAGEKMRRNKTVIVVRIVFALLILCAIFGLIRKTVSAPVLWNDGGAHQASSYATSRGISRS